jgi:hypothetical protein
MPLLLLCSVRKIGDLGRTSKPHIKSCRERIKEKRWKAAMQLYGRRRALEPCWNLIGFLPGQSQRRRNRSMYVIIGAECIACGHNSMRLLGEEKFMRWMRAYQTGR